MAWAATAATYQNWHPTRRLHLTQGLTRWVLAFMQGMASQLLYDPAPEYVVRRQCEWIVDGLLS